MAAHGTDAVELGSAAPFDDYDAHRGTYLRFLRLLKYCIGGIVILLILMALFLI